MAPTTWPYRATLSAILFVHAALLLGLVRLSFITVDEVGHVPAGLSHWRTDQFGAYRVNPPLARMLAALPMLSARPKLDLQRLNVPPTVRSEWPLGFNFLAANGRRSFDLVCLARLPGILWSLLGAGLLARWARTLHGEGAGLLAAALWCFEPTVMAFAALVVPDIPATVAGLATTYGFWCYLQRPSWRRALGCGVLLGIAQLTKFTLLILYGVWPLMALLVRSERRSAAGEETPRTVPWGIHALAIVVLSVLIINLGYGFRGTGMALGEFPFVSRTFRGGPAISAEAPSAGNRFRGTYLGDLPVPLPSDYVRGVDVQRRDFESGFPSYLAGRWRNRGWWYYYLYALGVKVPLGFLGLVLWALALTVREGSRADWAIWLPGAAILAFVSSQTGINHHMRYVLPAFPFVILGTARLGAFLKPWHRTAGPLVLGLLGWGVVSSLAVYPHSQSYFNEAAGGPVHGSDHLIDSNIDWGQDLLFLKRWLDRHPEAQPIGLAYYNLVDPGLMGIPYFVPPTGPTGLFPKDAAYNARFGPKPGYYAISVNYLKGSTSFAPPNGQHQWLPMPRRDAYAYFKQFRPIARAGYSIWIYQITPEQAAAARRRMGLPPLP